MSFDKGFDFRATLGFATDPANCLFASDATAYSSGQTYGWTSTSGLSSRDRNAGLDPRLAGIVFNSNASGGGNSFRVDVSASGQYDVALALHDNSGGGSNCFAEILDSDGSTVLATIGPTTPSPTDNAIDANGSQWSEAAWPGSNTTNRVTLTGTAVYLRIGKTATAGTTTLGHVRFTAVNTASYAVAGPNSAASLPSNHNGNIVLTVTKSGGTFAGTETFTVSGVTGWAKVSQSVTNGATTATVTVSCPAVASPPAGATGTLTVSDGTLSATIAVATPTLGLSVTSGSINGTQAETLTGTHTLWQSETASGLFALSGGTGASVSNPPTVSSNTSASDTLTKGSATGTLTVTDASTGAQATFTATPVKNVVVFLGDSLTFGTDCTGSDGVVSHSDASPITTGTSKTYPAQVMEALGTSGWDGFNHGYSGKTISQIAAQYATDSVVALKNASAAYNVLVVLAGTNNLNSGSSASAGMETDLQSLYTTLLGDGWKVIACAVPPYKGTFGTLNDSDRATVNSWLGANWRTLGLSGFACAPSATGGDTRIGTLASASDATYFTQSDVPHWIDAGAGINARAVAQAVFEVQNAGGSSGTSGGSIIGG